MRIGSKTVCGQRAIRSAVAGGVRNCANAGKRLPRQQMPRQARDDDQVLWVVTVEPAIAHLVGNTPAPAIFHRSHVDIDELRIVDPPVALLDQNALNPIPPQLDRQCQPDGPPANNRNRHVRRRIRDCLRSHLPTFEKRYQERVRRAAVGVGNRHASPGEASSCRSSESSNRQPVEALAESITESQILSLCSVARSIAAVITSAEVSIAGKASRQVRMASRACRGDRCAFAYEYRKEFTESLHRVCSRCRGVQVLRGMASSRAVASQPSH